MDAIATRSLIEAAWVQYREVSTKEINRSEEAEEVHEEGGGDRCAETHTKPLS
jgi:hypothetical protein